MLLLSIYLFFIIFIKDIFFLFVLFHLFCFYPVGNFIPIAISLVVTLEINLKLISILPSSQTEQTSETVLFYLFLRFVYLFEEGAGGRLVGGGERNQADSSLNAERHKALDLMTLRS